MENPVLPSSCVTPAGMSIEVQNEWEENTLLRTRNSTTTKKMKDIISCYILLIPIFKKKQLRCNGINSRTDTRVVVFLKYAPLTLGQDNSSCESDEYNDFDVFRTSPNNARGTARAGGLSYIV